MRRRARCEPEIRPAGLKTQKRGRGFGVVARLRLAGFGEATFGFRKLEVRGGIEPPNRAFAELGLTTWLPHRSKTSAQLGSKNALPQELKYMGPDAAPEPKSAAATGDTTRRAPALW